MGLAGHPGADDLKPFVRDQIKRGQQVGLEWIAQRRFADRFFQEAHVSIDSHPKLLSLTLDTHDIDMVELYGIDPVEIEDALGICRFVRNANAWETICIGSNVRLRLHSRAFIYVVARIVLAQQ